MTNVDYNKYKKLHPDSDIPKITPHVLRHTFCSNMINSGASIKVVRYLMGHSSATITYTHIDYETVKDQIKNIYNI